MEFRGLSMRVLTQNGLFSFGPYVVLTILLLSIVFDAFDELADKLSLSFGGLVSEEGERRESYGFGRRELLFQSLKGSSVLGGAIIPSAG